jgi:hypothetical protein
MIFAICRLALLEQDVYFVFQPTDEGKELARKFSEAWRP